MLRLAGILTGSALVIGFLLLALGRPEFSTRIPAAPAAALYPDTIDVEVSAAATTPDAGVTNPGAFGETDAPEPLPAQTDELQEQSDAMAGQSSAADASGGLILENESDPPPAAGWYAFWSPFRSEIAANGFVAKLQEKTGIDYRVVKIKTGVYEVAFAYTDEADIAAALERISSATGLDMNGG